MIEKQYRLLKDYESPCIYRHAGSILTEKEWVECFDGLQKGDCKIKTDWFEEVIDGSIEKIKLPQNESERLINQLIDRVNELLTFIHLY